MQRSGFRLTMGLLTLLMATVWAGARPARADFAQSFEVQIALTKLRFGSTTTLFDRSGIRVRAACISSFDNTGLCGDDVPSSGDHVAWMYFENVSASNAVASAGGSDLDFGPGNPPTCSYVDYEDGSSQYRGQAEHRRCGVF